MKQEREVIVVSSAMSGTTNDLINKSKKISNNFDRAEYDCLLASGEQIACSLIAGRLNHLGIKSRSWMSWQLPIITEGPHSASKIYKIHKKEILKYINSKEMTLLYSNQDLIGK